MLIGSECGLTAMVLVMMVVKAMVLTMAVTVTVPAGRWPWSAMTVLMLRVVMRCRRWQ